MNKKNYVSGSSLELLRSRNGHRLFVQRDDRDICFPVVFTFVRSVGSLLTAPRVGCRRPLHARLARRVRRGGASVVATRSRLAAEMRAGVASRRRRRARTPRGAPQRRPSDDAPARSTTPPPAASSSHPPIACLLTPSLSFPSPFPPNKGRDGARRRRDRRRRPARRREALAAGHRVRAAAGARRARATSSARRTRSRSSRRT